MDAAPLRSILHLFDSPVLEYGKLFYSDFLGTHTRTFGETSKPEFPEWEFVRVRPYATREVESGVLMLDKRRSWRELNLALHLTRHEVLMQKGVIYGDKDM